MFVRQVTLDVQAWHSAPKDEGTAVRRPWWARSVLMAVVVILAWVPFVILQFQSGGRSSSEPMVPKANYDTLNATLTTTTSTLETADRDRNQLKQQLANAQSRLQDVQHQLEEVRRIAHQPPPPPPPEDQIPVNWQPDFQLNWIAGPKIIWIRFIGQATALAHIKDTYIISELTGHKEQLSVVNPANFSETWSIDQIEPVTLGAQIYLIYQFRPPLLVPDFLNQWGAFEFHVIYDTKEYVRSYTQDYINDKMAREMPGIIGPRVTKKYDR